MSHKKHKHHKKGHNKKGLFSKEFFRGKTFFGIGPRTMLYLILVIVAFCTFIIKIEELNSKETLKIQLVLLELSQKGYF